MSVMSEDDPFGTKEKTDQSHLLYDIPEDEEVKNEPIKPEIVIKQRPNVPGKETLFEISQEALE
jgi:hypothetical protein